MYDRRSFLKASGAVLGTGLVSSAAGAQYDQFEGYRLVGEAPVQGINEVVVLCARGARHETRAEHRTARFEEAASVVHV